MPKGVYRTLVRGINSRHSAEQRGLTTAVFSHNSYNTAFFYIKGNSFECLKNFLFVSPKLQNGFLEGKGLQAFVRNPQIPYLDGIDITTHHITFA